MYQEKAEKRGFVMIMSGMNEKIKGKKGLLLKRVSVNGYVCGDFVEFSLSQLYENRSDKNIDAIYTFPLPDTAVITGFEAELGGRTLKAMIEEKDEALRLFDEATGKGINTFTLEQQDEDIFQISIGNILPNETVKVKISYMDQLIYEDDSYELIIPSIEGAKFVEEENEDEMEAEESYKLFMNLFVESMDRMEFESPSHSINVEREDDNLSKITFKNKNERLDSDFILLLRDVKPEEASGMSYKYYDAEGEKGILYLRLLPKLEADDEDGPQNYDFLIDISKSMEGDKLEEEKNALQLCIRNLSEDDSFNIVAFGKEKKCFSTTGKVPFNDENLRKATEWIEALTIERGANIYEALKYALEEKNQEGYSTIILFTDDDVDEEEQILEYVKNNIGDNRIFPIGIDTSVNSHFINKLAEYGYGKPEFIYPDERIDDMVLRQFNRITNPQVDVLEIDWGQMDVETTYPRTIEYLYDREPFSIFAKVKGEIGGNITIKGKVGDEDYIQVVDLDDLDLEENASLIQKVWSRKRIESIEERMRSARGEVAEAMKNKIIEISKESGIISSQTTFVMLEQIEEPVLGMALNRMIPINIAEEVMKDISEGYFLDTPGFSKKSDIRETMAEEKVDIQTARHTLKYDTENMLRILARSQNADGAICNLNADSDYKKMESTVTALLAFALSKEDINIYVDQLNKALQFIVKGLNNPEITNDEKLDVLILLTLHIYNNRGFVRRKVRVDVDNALTFLINTARANGYIAVENVMNSGSLDVTRLFISMILGISKDFALQDKEIITQNNKNSIDKIAKLVLSKTL
jgi:Ca-activated chloride channel family protein